MDYSKYNQLTENDLLRGSVVHGDTHAAQALQSRHRTRSTNELVESAKKNKATSQTNLLPVLQAALRCVSALRPNPVLTNPEAENKTFIGKNLLHPDMDTVQITVAVLESVVSEEMFCHFFLLCFCFVFCFDFFFFVCCVFVVLIVKKSGLFCYV